jgi:hypothetical protein
MTSPEMTEDLHRRRSPWLTVPLHLVGWTVLAADLWGTVFWARVGGPVGWWTAVIGAVAAVVLVAVLIRDARRQFASPRRDRDGASRRRPGTARTPARPGSSAG